VQIERNAKTNSFVFISEMQPMLEQRCKYSYKSNTTKVLTQNLWYFMEQKEINTFFFISHVARLSCVPAVASVSFVAERPLRSLNYGTNNPCLNKFQTGIINFANENYFISLSA